MADEKFVSWSEFDARMNREMVPRMQGAIANVVLVPEAGKLDAKICVEVGFSVLQGMPLILMVGPKGFVSPELRRVAKKIFCYKEKATEVLPAIHEYLDSL